MLELGILHFGAFVVAGLLLNLTPGPDLLYTSAQAGARGARAGWVAALGIGTGGLFHVLLGALGVSALLAASASAFALLKLADAAWLVWLGVRMLRPPRAQASPAPDGAATVRAARDLRRIWLDGVSVSVLNPKVALFFLAFVPQFIDPATARPALAFAVLGAVFVVNGTLVTGAIGTIAAAVGGSLRARPAEHGWRRVAMRVAGLLPRAIGALFVALGLRLLLEDA